MVVYVLAEQRCFYFHGHGLGAVFQQAVNSRVQGAFQRPFYGAYAAKRKAELLELSGQKVLPDLKNVKNRQQNLFKPPPHGRSSMRQGRPVPALFNPRHG
jgi:hypothetical protein